MQAFGVRNFSQAFILVATITGFVLMPLAARAETKVAVINIQEIMAESSAAKSIHEQLGEHRKAFQEEFSRYERTLAEEEKRLAEERSAMNPEEFAKRRQEFENKVLETRKLVQKRQRSLEEAAGKALNKIREEVLEIVSALADQEQYDLVITRQNIILAQKEMDVTEQVMVQLNQSLKEVPLQVETQ